MRLEPCLCGDPECRRCFPGDNDLPVKRYRCTFIGRELGAIGIFHVCQVEVDALGPEDAKVACYETHEHISGFHAEEIGRS